MLSDFRNGPTREKAHANGAVRPSEFRESVEERTQLEAGPVEYATEPDQVEPRDYYATHGETSTQEAAPVYLAEPPPHENNWTDWTSGTLAVNPQPMQIGDASRTRTRFVVRNLDAANPIFLARLRTDTNMAAFELPAGQEIEMLHNGPIAVSGIDGTRCTYLAEYDVDDPA